MLRVVLQSVDVVNVTNAGKPVRCPAVLLQGLRAMKKREGTEEGIRMLIRDESAFQNSQV